MLQLLAVRIGATTSTSLPTQTRLLFLRLEAKYPKYRKLLRCCLYLLYGLAEIAIIGTDLAELLGSAIALNLYVLQSNSSCTLYWFLCEDLIDVRFAATAFSPNYPCSPVS